MNLKLAGIGFLGIAFSLTVWAQSAELPVVKSGDTWTYIDTIEKGPSSWRQTHDELAVTRVTASSIYYLSKQSGSTQPAKESVTNLDWSRIRDINGVQTVVNQPLSFPLEIGKTWSTEYTEQHPNKQHKSEYWHHNFTVIGFETVQVPAGTFNAFKIEAEGQWTAEIEPTNTVVQGGETSKNGATMVSQVKKAAEGTASGRTYKVFWYVPEVKRFVKSEEEYFSGNGVRNERYQAELESYKVSD